MSRNPDMPHQRFDARRVVTKAVPSANVIQIGNMVALDGSDQPYVAADETWDTDLETTQANFCAKFLGIAMERSLSGETKTISIATAGVNAMLCAAATFELGDRVGPAKAAGDALLSNTVIAVTKDRLAVGVVHRREGSNVTEVEVDMHSTVVAPLSPVEADMGIQVLEQSFGFGDMTDNADTTGYIDLDVDLPAQCFVVGVEFDVTAGFTGDTTATAQAGDSSNLDRFTAKNDLNVLAVAKVGSEAPDAAGNAYVAAATTVRVTITGAADFTSITAGAMTARVVYAQLP
jgi:hypothetical protein